MNYILSFLLGCLSSILASFLFLYYVLTILRPRIAISPYISYAENYDVPGQNVYYFKFINQSRHPAFDVRLRICKLQKIPTGNGQMHEKRADLNLKVKFLAHIPKYKKIKKDSIFAGHAIVFTCLDDIRPVLLDSNQCVEVQVILRHGLTGLGKVYKHEFSTINTVKDGEFDFGNNLTVS